MTAGERDHSFHHWLRQLRPTPAFGTGEREIVADADTGLTFTDKSDGATATRYTYYRLITLLQAADAIANTRIAVNWVCECVEVREERKTD